jgi:hypothetical protein
MPIVISIKSEDDIPSLNKKDVVARFTRDGCTHCESSQDAWDKVCKILEHEYEDKEKTAVTEVESRLENALGFQFPDGSPYIVRGYPTVANFKQGVFAGEHDGGRTAKELIVHIHDVLKLNKKPKRKTRRSKHKRRRRTHESHKRRAPHIHSSRHRRSPHRRRSSHRHRDTPRRRDKYRRRTRRKPIEVIDLSELMSGGKRIKRKNRRPRHVY